MSSGSPDRETGASDRPRPQRLSETGQRVFECLSLGLVVFDHQLEILHHNPAARFLVREFSSISDALGAGAIDSQYQDWRAGGCEVIDSGKQHRFEHVVFRDPQGREMLLNLLCIALTDSTGQHITGGTLVIEDVTAAVGMEKRLAVSERMAAVGKLAARVAHELNNPLDGILRYINLSIRAGELGMNEKIQDYLGQARSGLLRMTQIVRELVEFSRSAHAAFDDASVNTIVEESIRVMSDKAVESGVSIVCKLEDGLPAIRGANIFQVFCNLIKNAIDAMPTGGTLTVSTERTERELLIQFSDTGVGLPDEADKIFEPFFTTKPPGKGTGLGLAVSKDIVEKYNGRIDATRRQEGGTKFAVSIPLESCAPARMKPVPKPFAAKTRENKE